MHLIVFDTEATDRTPGQLCQLAYLLIKDGSITGKNMFFAVDSMSEGAQNVHGMSISDLDTLSGGMRFADCADEILADFSRADMLVGHNVSADVRYLRTELARTGRELPAIETFCTMNYFTPITMLKRRYGGHPKPPRLEELWTHYALDVNAIAAHSDVWFGGGGTAHDARFDAAATYMCLLAATQNGDLTGLL